jgi:carbon starvation protein CstA
MTARNGNLAGWILTVIALLLLASDGNFGMLAVLIPISFLLACVMIGPSHETAQVTKVAKSGRLELKK